MKAFLVLLLIITACAQANNVRTDCRSDADCQSGVCNLMKADNGVCAAEPCIPGERTTTNHFFCNIEKEWQQSKLPGDSCTYDYECFRQSCFMNPSCELADIPAVTCTDNVCVSEFQLNECEQQGMKKILQKDQFNADCFESLAQRVLPTVCAPCGNGICDDVESRCNCPEDCKW